MQVEVSSDKPVSDAAVGQVVAVVESGLARHKDRLTRAEVHLKNVGDNGPTKPLGCTIEVRPAGRAPVAASHDAANAEDAASGAADKLGRLLESLFGRLDSTRGGASASGLPT